MIYLTLYTILLLLILILPIIGVFPLKEGPALNSMFYNSMPNVTGKDIGTWNSVLAQEKIEGWAAWVGAFVFATPIAVLIILYSPVGILSLILPFITWNWRSTDWGRRQLEYVGWSSEWVYHFKENTNAPKYESFSVYSNEMKRRYKVFSSMSEQEVENALKKRIPIARLLVKIFSYSIVKDSIR